MRRAFIFVQVLVGSLFLTGVIVFHFALHLSWVDSIYFVIATMTTVGYGDINLLGAPASLKIFSVFVMLGGAASMAAAFGLITDFLLAAHFEKLFGRRRKKMEGHIVLCGLGNVGIRVLEEFVRLGEQVIVLERDEDSRFLDMAKALKVRVIQGDIRVPASLEEAEIKGAKSLVAVSDDDVANLEAALNARELKPGIHVVLRIFDATLARHLKTGFGIDTVFSTSALAAPGFAMAALDPGVMGGFYVDEELMLNAELKITKDAPLDGMSTDELLDQGEVSILAHTSAKTGRRRLHPSDAAKLAEGDRIVVSATQAFYRRLKGLNEAS